MEEVLKAVGIVFVTVSLYAVLNAMDVKNAKIYSLGGSLILLMFCVPGIKELLSTVKSEIGTVSDVEYIPCICKIIFAVIICDIASGIAKEASHPYLANCIDYFTRIEITVISIPIFKALLDCAVSYLKEYK